MDFAFDLPLWISGPAIIALMSIFSGAGLLFVRHRILPRLRIKQEDSEFSGAMVQAIMVFYGLAVALIAVNVWQTYSDVAKLVSQEATSVAALFRDLNGYPEPPRSILEQDLKAYLENVIEEAWPLQRHGKLPSGGVSLMNRFQKTLLSFEPSTEGQRALHQECLGAFNRALLARRLRLDALGTGLPDVMWVVIVAGAVISLSSSFFFRVEDARLHLILVVFLAAFMGLIVFMILALDRPFRGDLGLSADSYRLVLEQVLSNPAQGAGN